MSLEGLGGPVLPVFALIALGYLATRLRIFDASVGDGLGAFVTTLAIPALILRTILTADLGGVSPWPLWLAYFTGIALTWLAASALSRGVLGLSRADAVIAGVSASYSNLVLIGVPFIVTAFGEAGAVPLFLLVAVHLPVMMAVGALLTARAQHMEATERGTPSSAGRLLRGLTIAIVLNPIILAILIGGAARAAGLGLPGPLRPVIDLLAAAGTPCALVALGIALTRYRIGGQALAASAIGTLKLLLMPAIVFGMARLLGLPPLWTAVATVGAALPSGVNAYLMAQQFRTGHALAASTITITTALSVVTAGAWLALVGRP